MTPDIEKYRKYVDRFDLSEERKVELIHTVWAIMESFVDRAFGLDPVQQVNGVQMPEDAIVRQDSVNWKDHVVSREFGEAADTGSQRKDEQ